MGRMRISTCMHYQNTALSTCLNIYTWIVLPFGSLHRAAYYKVITNHKINIHP